MENMDKDLRQNIAETYDGSAWKPVTGLLWQDGTPWQLWKFEEIVEFAGESYRCVIVEKSIYDPDDTEAVDYSIDILSEAWKI